MTLSRWRIAGVNQWHSNTDWSLFDIGFSTYAPSHWPAYRWTIRVVLFGIGVMLYKQAARES